MEFIEVSGKGKCEKSTVREDKNSHVDFWWETPKWGRIGVDVKGRNKWKRSDKCYSDIHWIEMKNVYGGKGWVYGNETYVAFCTRYGVAFVRPQRLIEIYDEKVDKSVLYDYNPMKLYAQYTRSRYLNPNGKPKDDLTFAVEDSLLIEKSDFILDIVLEE